jgi:hypothetical protein
MRATSFEVRQFGIPLDVPEQAPAQARGSRELTFLDQWHTTRL